MHPTRSVAFTLALVASAAAQTIYSIDSYGAVSGNYTRDAAVRNGLALLQAVQAANATSGSAVLVPAGRTYALLPAVASFAGTTGLTLLLEGIISAYTADYNQTDGWPGVSNGTAWDVLSFSYPCTGLTITSQTGQGTLLGNGYDWWWYVLVGNPDHRPNLLGIHSCGNVTVANITLRDAPQYHVNALDIGQGLFDSVTVTVDLEGQAALLQAAGQWRAPIDGHVRRELTVEELATRLPRTVNPRTAGIPTFPLNTDGIDISGYDVMISNFNCTNYDDAVAVKPLHGGQSVWGDRAACTNGITVSHSHVTLGVGMSMGSVPPHANISCIRDVSISNVSFTAPIKGIYIKPNPVSNAADPGSGLIANISYTDITMDTPLWWSIWMGTQQQDQPGGGADTGCSFWYPLPNTTCPTDPYVTLANITMANVAVHKPLLSPGVLIANATNPATGIVFSNVQFDSAPDWPVAGGAFLCLNVQGTTFNSTPAPSCLQQED